MVLTWCQWRSGVQNSKFLNEYLREIEAIFKNTSHVNQGPIWISLAYKGEGKNLETLSL